MTLTKKKNGSVREEFDLDEVLELLQKINYGNFYENASVTVAWERLKHLLLKFPYDLRVLLRDGRIVSDYLKMNDKCIFDTPDETYCFIHHCGAYDEQCNREDCPHCQPKIY